MSSVALEFDGVWKKFTKGETYDCLRDLVPAAVRRLFGKRRNELSTREFWALRDVSFQIKRGEAVGIIGPNGSGKSTTLKLISSILKPTQGHIAVDGRLSALIEVAAGFHPDLTGRENVYLNGTILGMKNPEIDRKFDEIVEFSGMEDFIDTPVKRYSSGMFARLGFSVAAHVDPDILLVDEVLAVGDMRFQQRCLEKMQEKIKSDVAVVFVSHNLAAVASLCRRAILLNKGNLTVDGRCDEVLEAYVAAMRTGGSTAEQGNPKLRILEVEFKADGGHNSGILPPHTRCEIRVVFHCESPVPRCNIAFLICRTTDLRCCYEATTAELGYPVFALNPGDRLAVRFQFNAHLTRGHYRIDLNVCDPDGAGFLFEANGAASFTIDEQVTSTGFANVGLEASIQKIPLYETSLNRV